MLTTVVVLCLVVLSATSQDVEDTLTCDPSPGGDWSPMCDMMDVFAVQDNFTARFHRAVEVLPGLRLPSLGDCPEDQPLSRQVGYIMNTFFSGCMPVLRYDRFLEASCGVQRLLSGSLDMALTHGRITGASFSAGEVSQSPVPRDGPCITPVFLLQHVEDARSIIRAGTSRAFTTLLVTASPLWRVEEFLQGWEQRPLKIIIIASAHRARPVISTLHLAPWFPHHITVAMRHEPPYTIHRPNDTVLEWSGIEPTLLRIISQKLNFTYATRLVPEAHGGEILKDAVAQGSGGADIGCGGLYLRSVSEDVSATVPITQDCAVFMTRASTALPRHRAILGPFQLAVWLTLTSVYMLLTIASAAGPHNKEDPASAQSRLGAFWLVYGTFTNAFVVRDRIWSNRASVRLLLTFYWIFTVIITAAYTSSIIAFVTLPVFPSTIDTAEEIITTPGFKWGTLGSSGWDTYLRDTDDPVSRHVQAGFEWLPRVEDGIVNVSRSSKYAFLGARERLQYESSDDLSGILSGKKALHLGSQCFLPLLPAFVANPTLRPALDPILLTLIQAGMIEKTSREVAWQEQRRRLRTTSSGVIRTEFTRMMPHERKLGLEDVIGTFLLLGAGMLMGLTSFGSEMFMQWFRVADVMKRVSSAMAIVKRRVSNRSGSNSGSSSRRSLRLRSGRIWSRFSRGSHLGSMLDVVPERGAVTSPPPPQEGSTPSVSPVNGGFSLSAPDLERLEPLDLSELEIAGTNLSRPRSSIG